MNRAIVGSIVCIFLILFGCSKDDDWSGFVYPDKENLSNHLELGDFETLDQCRAAARELIDVSGWPSVADYECSLNCKPMKGYDLLQMCEETLR